jgi:flotillin
MSHVSPVVLIAVGIVLAVILVALLFKLFWRVAEPNEALVVSGLGARSRNLDTAEGLGFRIITGKGTLVIPGFQVARRLSLDTRSTDVTLTCVTHQGIPVKIRAVVIYKVGDDYASVANAARRFLDQQSHMDERTHNVFAGHLRSVIGALTVEDLIRNRDRLTEEVRNTSATEMSKLGLVIDSLQIQEIDDETGYIANLGRPHAAAVAAQARIASAERDQEATKAEQVAAAEKSAAYRDSEIKQAAYRAETDQAQARTRQAGPLAEAVARQEVVVAETRAAELEADLSEKRLESEVRKPADARAYEQRTLADADRDARISGAEADARETELRAAADASRVKQAATAEAEATKSRGEAAAFATQRTGEADAAAVRARGLAEAESERARGLAEADAIKARAEALAENQEAVVAQQLAENWPAIVSAAGEAFGNIDQLIVLNGADGMAELFAKALTLGGTGLGLARSLMNGNSNGSKPPAEATTVTVKPVE